MKIEYDKTMCAGWFQCVQEWDAFEMDMISGKAELNGSQKVDGGLHVREIPDGFEEEAKAAAQTCPVDAIKVYDDEKLVAPSD